MANRKTKSKVDGSQAKGVAAPVDRRCQAFRIDSLDHDSPLDAALHLLFVLQALSHNNGEPCDGFRFRECIIEGRKLLKTVGGYPV